MLFPMSKQGRPPARAILSPSLTSRDGLNVSSAAYGARSIRLQSAAHLRVRI